MLAPAPAALEPRDAMVSVVFVDMRDFTAFAHRATAREAIAVLNEFYGLVVPVLTRHGAHIDAYLGDGVLAVFGAPEPQPDHADRAVAAATAIARAARRPLSIGINSGLVVVGTIGGGERFELGIIGDPVNVAARVEQATRETGDRILLTEATRCLLERPGPELAPRGSIALKGKPDPVAVHAVTIPGRSPDTKEPR